MKKIQKRTKVYKKILFLAGLLMVFFIVGEIIFYLTDTRQSNESNYGSNQTNPSDETPISDQNSGNRSISSTKDEIDVKNGTALSPRVTPRTPSGTLVSNHRPNLLGSPTPNLEQSTCTTTPGAYCTITFTNGSKKMSLEKKQTDSNGNASWTWRLQDINLSEGEWTIKAVASNGEFLSYAEDTIKLLVEK